MVKDHKLLVELFESGKKKFSESGYNFYQEVPLSWNSRTTSGGICKFSRKNGIITPSIEISIYAPDGELEGIMVHEMIHAYLPHYSRHNYDFRNMAAVLKAPLKCSDLKKAAMQATSGFAFPYRYICDLCGWQKRLQRRPKKTVIHACPKCCNKYNHGRFSTAYILRFEVLSNDKILALHCENS